MIGEWMSLTYSWNYTGMGRWKCSENTVPYCQFFYCSKKVVAWDRTWASKVTGWRQTARVFRKILTKNREFFVVFSNVSTMCSTWGTKLIYISYNVDYLQSVKVPWSQAISKRHWFNHKIQCYFITYGGFPNAMSRSIYQHEPFF
jgi:hypothetical protein